MDLPYAVDAEVPLSAAELAILEEAYESEVRTYGLENVHVQVKFNLAWGLVKSQERQHQIRAATLLGQICEDPQRGRECAYYLALVHWKLGNFDRMSCVCIGVIVSDRSSLRTHSVEAKHFCGKSVGSYLDVI